MQPAAFLGDFRIVRPAYRAGHEESVAWLSRAHAKAESVLRREARLRRRGLPRDHGEAGAPLRLRPRKPVPARP